MRIRIVVYGATVLLLAALSAFVAFLMLDHSGPGALAPNPGLASALVNANATERQRLLDETRQVGVDVTLYDRNGAVVATNVLPAMPLRPNDEVATLPHPAPESGVYERLVSFHIADKPLPITFDVNGSVALLRPAPPRHRLFGFAVPLLASVAALVLLSLPVANAMTRRLRALEDVARGFGNGDLSRRADTTGTDEVSKMAITFNAMADRIAELRRHDREFLAGISHELRTPMARMSVLLELVAHKPTEASRYVAELGHDLAELEGLLENAIETFRLDLAQSRAGEPPVRLVRLDLRDLAEEAAEGFRRRSPSHRLEVSTPPLPVFRDADARLLRRAVMNLLDNACKYSPHGAVVELRVEETGEINVRDRGDGIASNDLSRVFEPFVQAHGDSAGGVGLGLTFVKLVMALHNGCVLVTSKQGQGSTFSLVLGSPDSPSQPMAQ